MNAREALIALNLIEGIGPVRVRKLLEFFQTPERVLRASMDQLSRISCLTDDVRNAIVHWEDEVDLLGEMRRIRENDCWILIQEDELYPKLLRHIYDPPIVLYVRGSITPNDGTNSLAVVGSRQTTHYGREQARNFSRNLAKEGITVVSGGARGIDTAAHRGALEGGGRTIAVLGTGINHVYPAENAELFDTITSHGALITQFPFNRPGDRQSFPVRNRIVAGMTMGCLVIEAALTSGALITCNMAVDNGRSVFAVPGRVDSPRSQGCHDLIKRGAKLCENVEDILVEFEYLFPSPNSQTPLIPSSSINRYIPDESARIKRNKNPLKQPANIVANKKKNVLDTFKADQFQGIEKKIFCLLSENSELDLDEIIRNGGMSSSEANTGLLKLEMKKAVVRLPGRRFALVNA